MKNNNGIESKNTLILKYDHLGIGHWTNETLEFNREYKRRNNINPEHYYVGLRKKISKKVKKDETILVIDMNNDTNKIVSFALITNRFKNGIARGIKIYPKQSGWKYANEYIYKSKYCYNVDDFEGQEEILDILELMENRLFKGSNHYKRGQGIITMDVTKFPNYDRVILFLNSLFNV